MQYAYQLEYEERPNYGYLTHLLVKILLDRNKVPDTIFDWHLIKVSIFSLIKRHFQ